jgi:hypothetical protein
MGGADGIAGSAIPNSIPHKVQNVGREPANWRRNISVPPR